MDLPFYSEENEKSLRSLLIELENISEKNKKINLNNQLKHQLADIDLHEYKRQLAKYEEEKDTNDAVSSVATWRSEMVHEERMLTKYQKLLTLDDMVCPTCEGEVNEMFVKV